MPEHCSAVEYLLTSNPATASGLSAPSAAVGASVPPVVEIQVSPQDKEAIERVGFTKRRNIFSVICSYIMNLLSEGLLINMTFICGKSLYISGKSLYYSGKTPNWVKLYTLNMVSDLAIADFLI